MMFGWAMFESVVEEGVGEASFGNGGANVEIEGEARVENVEEADVENVEEACV